MSERRRIPLSVPSIGELERRYVNECLESGWVSSAGPWVTRFEEAIATRVGVPHAVATVNGTAALHLALLVAGVERDDEVLVPNLTFVAPVNAVSYCGAHPVLVDAHPVTLCMAPKVVQRFLEERCVRRDGVTSNRATGRRVKAIMPVHVFGHVADMDALSALARDWHLTLIEDASESLGSTWNGRPSGGIGHLGGFSFNGNKIVTCGGGGMLVTANEKWARRARHLSTQAKLDPFAYDHDAVGYNYRLTSLQAALGLAQLERLDEFLLHRRETLARYQRGLNELKSIRLLDEEPPVRSNFWFFTLQVPEPDREPLMQYLIDRQIEVRPVWKLMQDLPMFADCEAMDGDHARHAYSTCINLPCSADLAAEDVAFVCKSIRQYYGRHGGEA